MRKFNKILLFSVLMINISCFGGSLVSAQSLTTAQYGDWVLRCTLQTAAEGDEASKSCELIQDVRLQNSVRPLLQIAIGQLVIPTNESTEPTLGAVFQLPDTLFLPDGFALKSGDQSEKVPFIRCQQGACLAIVEMSDAWATAFSKTDEQITASATFYGQGTLAIPFSKRGYTEAKAAFDAAQ